MCNSKCTISVPRQQYGMETCILYDHPTDPMKFLELIIAVNSLLLSCSILHYAAGVVSFELDSSQDAEYGIFFQKPVNFFSLKSINQSNKLLLTRFQKHTNPQCLSQSRFSMMQKFSKKTN